MFAYNCSYVFPVSKALRKLLLRSLRVEEVEEVEEADTGEMGRGEAEGEADIVLYPVRRKKPGRLNAPRRAGGRVFKVVGNRTTSYKSISATQGLVFTHTTANSEVALV
jgi:hypothetical protein